MYKKRYWVVLLSSILLGLGLMALGGNLPAGVGTGSAAAAPRLDAPGTAHRPADCNLEAGICPRRR